MLSHVDVCALPLLSTHHALVMSDLSGTATHHHVAPLAGEPAGPQTQTLALLVIPELLPALRIAALMVGSFHMSTPPPQAMPAAVMVALPLAAGTAAAGL